MKPSKKLKKYIKSIEPKSRQFDGLVQTKEEIMQHMYKLFTGDIELIHLEKYSGIASVYNFMLMEHDIRRREIEDKFRGAQVPLPWDM